MPAGRRQDARAGGAGGGRLSDPVHLRRRGSRHAPVRRRRHRRRRAGGARGPHRGMPDIPPISSGPPFSMGWLGSSSASPFRVLTTRGRGSPLFAPLSTWTPEAAMGRAMTGGRTRPERRRRAYSRRQALALLGAAAVAAGSRRRWRRRRRWASARRQTTAPHSRPATARSRSCTAFAWRTRSARWRILRAPTCRPGSRPRIGRRARCWKAIRCMRALRPFSRTRAAIRGRAACAAWGARWCPGRSTAPRSIPGWRSATRSAALPVR